MGFALYILYLLAVPLLVMLLARRWSWIDKVSPMAVLYVIGLLVANLTPWLHDEALLEANNTIGSVCVPLAIALMLLSCNLAHWNTRSAIKAFLSGFFAILIVVVTGFFLFRDGQDSQRFAQVSAVAVGIYTGGIPNMGAIAQGVGMDAETYLYVTSYDLIVTGLYLVFVICLGKPVFRWLLPKKAVPATATATNGSEAAATKQPAEEVPSAGNKDTAFGKKLLVVLMAIVLTAAAYFFSKLFPEAASTPVLILAVTTFAIAASFLPWTRDINKQANAVGKQPFAFELGLYLVYVFCFSIANACDIRQMDLAGSLSILWYIFFVVFGSLVLQVLFSKFLGVDGDTALVASVALINSPPFVPLAAALVNNKDLIIVGIVIGLLGYMLGNYLGIGLYYLL